MKFTLFLLCFTVFVINTLSKKIRKNHSTIESIAYALGKTNTDQFYLNNKSKYRSVPYVDKLPQQGTPISDGLIETVDVIETDSNYYDGTIGDSPGVCDGTFGSGAFADGGLCVRRGECDEISGKTGGGNRPSFV